jgi:hypothetical protein
MGIFARKVRLRTLGAGDNPDQFPLASDFNAILDHTEGWANARRHAAGDGVADDTQGLRDANTEAAGRHLMIPAGTHVVSDDVTFTCHVQMLKGAVLQIASGKTVTFNGGFSAGVDPVFSGGGTVVFARAHTTVGHPEWWGAVAGPGDTTTAEANLVAFQKAVAALPVVQLQAADYFISNTLAIPVSHRVLRGHSRRWAPTLPATRLIVKGGTADVLLVGTAADPGSINGYVTCVEVRDLDLARDAAPTPPPIGQDTSGPAGMRIQHALLTVVERVQSTDSYLGFIAYATVRTAFRYAHAKRDSAGSSPTNDKFYGFFLDGTAPNNGAAGGNASTYLTDCSVELTIGSLSDSYGFALSGKPVDTFVLRPETLGVSTGIIITGDSSPSGNVDVHITDAIVDGFGSHGLYISGVGNWGAIDVKGGYFAPSGGASTTYGIRVVGTTGMIALTNNQTACSPNSLCMGLYIEDSQGVVARSNMHMGSNRPIILDASSSCVVEDIIANPGQTPTQAAVCLINASTRNRIAPVVKGQSANKFPQGVNLMSTGNEYNEINCTGIDPAAITGGATDKLHINGSAVTTTGLSGTNLVSGVMA